MADAEKMKGNDALLWDQIRALQARCSVLELRAKVTDEELAQVKREINSLTESLGGLVDG